MLVITVKAVKDWKGATFFGVKFCVTRNFCSFSNEYFTELAIDPGV